MHYLAVTELDARNELLEEVAGLVLAEAPGLYNPVKQLSPRSVLHDDAQVRAGHKHLLEADDVGVQQRLVVNQFPLDVPAEQALTSLSASHRNARPSENGHRARVGHQTIKPYFCRERPRTLGLPLHL